MNARKTPTIWQGVTTNTARARVLLADILCSLHALEDTPAGWTASPRWRAISDAYDLLGRALELESQEPQDSARNKDDFLVRVCFALDAVERERKGGAK